MSGGDGILSAIQTRIQRMTSAEATRIISRWAEVGFKVVLALEFGDLAYFEQRPGRIEMARPGVFLHRSGETSSSFWPARFGEILLFEEPEYEVLRLCRPAGLEIFDLVLIADKDEALDPDTVLLLAQTVIR